MSDSESDVKQTMDNQGLPIDLSAPGAKVNLWDDQALGIGYEDVELNAAQNDFPEDNANDLDELNDNLQDCFDDNLSLEVNFGDGSSCRASDERQPGISDPSIPNSKETSAKDSFDVPSDAGDTTPTASETVRSHSSSGNHSDTSVGSGSQPAKRNSLEIRNNIPAVGEVKSHSNHHDSNGKLRTKDVVPKIYKKSPGLARRLADTIHSDDRDSSSSERESEYIDTTVRSAQRDFENKLQELTATNLGIEKKLALNDVVEVKHVKSGSFEKLCDSLLGNEVAGNSKTTESDTSPDTDKPELPPGTDIENEYDYVKYARIQSGDSYVGMRLAYSSSNDSINVKQGMNGVMPMSNDEYLGSSHEGSPEKILMRQPRFSDPMHMTKVNEDTLTEIPLNGSDYVGSEEKNFSLSPEATECDSAEVESVISEEGKSSTSGMPAVEDGLSSSQCSDAEDTSMHDASPAELLKRRYKAEVAQELQATDNTDHKSMSITDNSSDSTPSHASETSGSNDKSREVDKAIEDIKSAIERTKKAAQQRAAQQNDEKSGSQDPVWIMRDSYVKKLGHHDDIQRVRDEYQRHREEEFQKQKEEQGYHGDEDDPEGVKFPYRNDGKQFPANKGFDSDEENDGSNPEFYERRRHVKGKKYTSIPSMPPDEPSNHRHSNQEINHCHSNQDLNQYHSQTMNQRYSHSETSLNRDNMSASHTRPVDRDHMPSRGHSQSLNHGGGQTLSQTSLDSSGRGSFPREQSFSAGVPNSRYHSRPNPHQYSAAASHNQPVDLNRKNEPIAASGGSPRQSTHNQAESPQGISQSTNRPPTQQHIPPPPSGEHRRRHRRYPSYEYRDDSDDDDDYYDDDDAAQTAYIKTREHGDYDTDEETDELLDKQYQRGEKVDIPELARPPVNRSAQVGGEQVDKRRSRAREVTLRDPNNETVLIEGVLFRARYLGSTQLISEGQPTKGLRMMQAQEAVGRIKAPEGENQPSTEVDLFVSIEKIMVLNTDLQEIMMDHALRTISYIADIGEILVIMARRGPVMSANQDGSMSKRKNKICCHVFETEEAQLIAQSIGQAFQVAYMEFLKANGIDDPGMLKEIDYQEVLNQQEIFGEELFLFSNKEMQKEVIVPKLKNEPLGVVIVESGWGSMVPTVVLANMSPSGAAARCGQLNIGDQIMSINGVSLVGLPLSSCQNYIKASKNQTVVKLNVVSCAPVVEVCIKRPDVKYQLGFSVQNGVICSLLRGGIAERGGVRVGHRIIEINGDSVVAVPHEKIVKMLATSVGEIHMKTMPTSIFRLLTGQDNPHYI